ncbi:hypothetical protein O6H91_10G007500 [Diphasiastrum complanatum]|uniref:Uncharacterized protein n=1 Tax=Diphasiastrum complanatum TaxID=34168 RepID=A0ACC2CEE2_DIPCM|nr:hypothetical protein O6H91_10G007500 [Diphasiastrum complanatum]
MRGGLFARMDVRGGKLRAVRNASILLMFLSVAVSVAATSEQGGLFERHKFSSLTPKDHVTTGEVFSSTAHLGRTLKQAAHSPSTTNNGSLVLAASRTRRPDPLDNFHKYRNGWDIRNKHYWASVGFTGLPGFALAALWLAFGLLFLLSLCCWTCCCRREGRDHHNQGRLAFLIPLLFLFLLTCAAIFGCALVYAGQGKFHSTLSNTLEYVVNQSRYTVENLHNVSAVLTEAASVNVGNVGVPANQKQTIQQQSTQLNSSADQLESKTEDNAHRIRRAINLVRLVMIIVAGVMLLLVLLGLSLVSCGFRPLIYILVFIGWFLVAATWILCGVFILLNNTMGDTCVAMQEWVANPDAQTNLDEILPCVDKQTANQTLYQSKDLTNSVVNVVDQAITLAFNNNLPPGSPLSFNQSGPAMPDLCSPYGPAPDYADQRCPADNVDLSNALGNWSHYICTSSNGNCTSTGRITQDIYKELVRAVTIANGLYVNVPFLVSVENCVFVRTTFQTVITKDCPDFRKYTKWVWIGLVLISGGSMFSILLWIICSRKHPRHVQQDPKYAQPIYRGASQGPANGHPQPVQA